MGRETALFRAACDKKPAEKKHRNKRELMEMLKIDEGARITSLVHYKINRIVNHVCVRTTLVHYALFSEWPVHVHLRNSEKCGHSKRINAGKQCSKVNRYRMNTD